MADFLISDVPVFIFLDGLLIAILVFHRHGVIKRLQLAFGCALRAMGPAIFQCCVAVLSLCLRVAIAILQAMSKKSHFSTPQNITKITLCAHGHMPTPAVVDAWPSPLAGIVGC
jgi:hypothetical protein